MISQSADPVGADVVEALAGMGYDYIELSLSEIVALPESAFASLVKRVNSSGIRCEACIYFFPRRIPLTGSQARLGRALAYAEEAMDRAARIGADTIVFGSSAARNVPAGFPMDAAWRQIVDLLQHLGPMAAQRGITIAIEPINKLESNIVNLAAEGLRLAKEVNHPNVQLLIDYYHLMLEKEDLGIIREAGAAIRHAHFAKVEGRTYPDRVEDDYRRFFRCLRSIGYARRCSIEACTADFAADAPRALALLRQIVSGQE